jgi:hypothetical protein
MPIQGLAQIGFYNHFPSAFRNLMGALELNLQVVAESNHLLHFYSADILANSECN